MRGSCLFRLVRSRSRARGGLVLQGEPQACILPGIFSGQEVGKFNGGLVVGLRCVVGHQRQQHVALVGLALRAERKRSFMAGPLECVGGHGCRIGLLQVGQRHVPRRGVLPKKVGQTVLLLLRGGAGVHAQCIFRQGILPRVGGQIVKRLHDQGLGGVCRKRLCRHGRHGFHRGIGWPLAGKARFVQHFAQGCGKGLGVDRFKQGVGVACFRQRIPVFIVLGDGHSLENGQARFERLRLKAAQSVGLGRAVLRILGHQHKGRSLAVALQGLVHAARFGAAAAQGVDHVGQRLTVHGAFGHYSDIGGVGLRCGWLVFGKFKGLEAQGKGDGGSLRAVLHIEVSVVGASQLPRAGERQ